MKKLNLKPSRTDSNYVIVYHGTPSAAFTPTYGYGAEATDYGKGFYTTDDLDIAREWAMYKGETRGYVHKYSLNLQGLSVLDFDSKYHSLSWLAVLVYNRSLDLCGPENEKARDVLIRECYDPSIESYDIVRGYRVDDSYVKFVREALAGNIDIGLLDRVLYFGDLGTQIFVQSKRAFLRLTEIFTAGTSYFECVTDRQYARRYEARVAHGSALFTELEASKENTMSDTLLDRFPEIWRI